MGAAVIELVCGLVFGIGLVLALSPWFTPPRTSAPWRPGKRLREDVARARVPGLSAARLVVLSLILGAIVALVVLAVTGAWPVALIVSVGVAFLPYAWVVSRVAARAKTVRAAWPEVIDAMVSVPEPRCPKSCATSLTRDPRPCASPSRRSRATTVPTDVSPPPWIV